MPVGDWQDDQCTNIVVQQRTGTKFCNACIKIFNSNSHRKFIRRSNGIYGTDVSYRHIRYLDTLQDSATRGCELCSHILRSMRARDDKYFPVQELRLSYSLTVELTSSEQRLPTVLNSLHIIFVYHCQSKTERSWLHWLHVILIGEYLRSSTLSLPCQDVEVLGKDEACQPTEASILHPSLDTDLFRWWLSNCLTDHTRCTRFYDKTYVPSRLLKISADTEGVCHSVTLIETCNYVPTSAYMALSHCWGHHDFLTLTTENRSRLLSGFDIVELPKTFQDAVHLTHSLGYSYLWIDSLCIIQNSDSDWEKEAFSMKKVYSNAICTIAATGAHDSSEGLHGFFERRQDGFCHVPVEASWSLGTESVLFMVDDLRRLDIVNSPLLKRAWVIQEMALSARKLHFANSQVHWQCQERLSCEAFPIHYPSPMRVDHLHEYQWPENRGARDSESLSSAWWQLVEAYSSGVLTNGSDKLAAFAGAAEQFRIINGGLTYTCGMWRERMPSDLLWSVGLEVHNSGKPRRRSQDYRAPSWSWLSLDDFPVREPPDLFGPSTTQPRLEILDVAIENAEGNAYGPIIAAALQVKGMLKSVRIEFKDKMDSIHELRIDDNSIMFKLDDEDVNIAGPNYCLPFYGGGTSDVVGLVLVPAVDDGVLDQLRRIAYFKAKASKMPTHMFDFQDNDGIWKPLQPTTFTLV